MLKLVESTEDSGTGSGLASLRSVSFLPTTFYRNRPMHHDPYAGVDVVSSCWVRLNAKNRSKPALMLFTRNIRVYVHTLVFTFTSTRIFLNFWKLIPVVFQLEEHNGSYFRFLPTHFVKWTTFLKGLPPT